MSARRGGVTTAAVATCAAVAILIGLGTWQMQRLSWKEGILARIEERIHLPPAPLPEPAAWPALDPDDLEYRPFTATGHFDHAREQRLYMVISDARGPFEGVGYFILTPLMLKDGAAVIVNRGFVPENRLDPSTRAEGQVEGEVRVTGLARISETPGTFIPEPDTARGIHFARDIPALARAMRLEHVAPFVIDADATPNPGGLPQGGETRINIPNRHLEYALTWYALAGTLLAVFGVWALQRRRGGA